MTDLGARCQQCHVTFRVTPLQLRAAGGLVRCGFCLSVFDARANPVPLHPTAPPEFPTPPEPSAWQREEGEWHPDQGFDRVRFTAMLGALPETTRPPEPPTAEPPEAPQPVEQPPLEPEPPLWVTPAPQRKKASPAGAAAVLLVGVATLALQILYFQADRLADDHRLQPLLGILCAALPCQFATAGPPVAAFQVERALVRPLPPDGLRLDAMLINRSDRHLSLPSIQVEFEDLDARPVAARTLAPHQYLGPGTTTELAAGQSLHLVLDFLDPGPEAVSYRITPLQ